ncbi:MAG TPA: hypothetical protein VKP65_14630, partial [Rhodothermales bacterium]|nr:hypothetical protein [Rhodothermales bacterium]
MRLLITGIVFCMGALNVAAQVPTGEYISNYSPGYAGEAMTISADSTITRHSWSDVHYAGDPSTLYEGIVGVLTTQGRDIYIQYTEVLLDSTGLQKRTEWSEPVDEWITRKLRQEQAYWSHLIAGELEGYPVFVWDKYAEALELCRASLQEPEPEARDDWHDWHSRRGACGYVFVPPPLYEAVDFQG